METSSVFEDISAISSETRSSLNKIKVKNFNYSLAFSEVDHESAFRSGFSDELCAPPNERAAGWLGSRLVLTLVRRHHEILPAQARK